MTIYNVLELIGGLSLLLFGMYILGESLTTISGGKMEQILERLSSTKFKGLLLGTGVTALIQSSSAATVMVIALVNSGVMKLKQAVPIIMGANIGTTVTGWILSLSGISGESFLVQILKPTTFTPVLAMIGMVLIFVSKKEERKAGGHALLGFSILMFGMTSMSDSLAPLQSDPNFSTAFQVFTNPIIGVVVGALFTALVQSSSAMTGILQALSTTGAMSYGSVIPLIMGQNIGTCITAILSSIGADRNAKRASVIHLSFNTIGTVIFMSLFYTIHFLRPFSFYNNATNQVGIAIIHTVFNFLTVLFLYPFTDQLVKVSKKIIPSTETRVKRDPANQTLRLLDPRFLDRPGFATEQAFAVLNKMMETTLASYENSVKLLLNYDSDLHSYIEKLENEVDEYEDALLEYTTKISAGSLNRADSRKLSIIMHTINDVERISDYSINIADQAKIKYESDVSFSDVSIREMEVYIAAVEKILAKTKEALADLDMDIARRVQPLEDLINEINKVLSDKHISRLQKGVCNIDNALNITEIYNSLERIADHSYNISVVIVQFSEEHYRYHDFESRHSRTSSHYQKIYKHYKDMFDPLAIQ